MLKEGCFVNNDSGCNASVANERSQTICWVKDGAAKIPNTVNNDDFVGCVDGKNGSACIVGE